ncbi:DUF512 domain-containing protein [Sporohalobacter salinus]|uniref:DUF512 domain-containing protein n=1 Tax=Sporohalobacter salinus TaxID=1494606 RepID=UPI001961BFE6|nr:DUF512 domain-containing protein [Sporohalobacter salinus]MBM7624050.1 pyruvate-formate lyase-activating enzyme [Sporohalobacter salinus]
MEYSAQQLVLLSVQERNILPITSHCNLNCVFCSHKYNPPEIETFNFGHRSLKKIKEMVEFLDDRNKIVIGESVTRIIEGEPFSHPKFKEILIYLRENFPQTKIQITTNGSYLDRERVKLLDKLGLIELNVSLNSSQPTIRKRLMADFSAERVCQGIRNLAEFEIPYYGSIVAMPQISGWVDIKETINFLNQNQARTVRVFLPGFTKLTPDKLQFDLKLWTELHDYIKQLNKSYRVPITVEPPLIKELTPSLQGVIADSPADKAGLQLGDEILEVDNKKVHTRVEAFYQLLRAKNPIIKYRHAGRKKEQKMNKLADEASGVVVDYDISWQRLMEIKEIITVNSARKVLFLTSVLAEDIIKAGIEKIKSELDFMVEIEVLSVVNKFFGGSIRASGLLVVYDFLKVVENNKGQVSEMDLVFLPRDSFNNWGYDLVGMNCEQLEEHLDCKVVVV